MFTKEEEVWRAEAEKAFLRTSHLRRIWGVSGGQPVTDGVTFQAEDEACVKAGVAGRRGVNGGPSSGSSRLGARMAARPHLSPAGFLRLRC